MERKERLKTALVKPQGYSPDFMELLHVRLTRERKKLCRSQAEFSERYNFNPHTYPKWESGKLTPSVHDLIRLCNIFECDLDYLLGEQEEKTRALTDIREDTGLSVDAIESIKLMNRSYLIEEESIEEKRELLSDLLSHPDFQKLFTMLLDEIDQAALINEAERDPDFKEMERLMRGIDRLKDYDTDLQEQKLQEGMQQLFDEGRIQEELRSDPEETEPRDREHWWRVYQVRRERKMHQWSISDTFLDIVKDITKSV